MAGSLIFCEWRSGVWRGGTGGSILRPRLGSGAISVVSHVQETRGTIALRSLSDVFGDDICQRKRRPASAQTGCCHVRPVIRTRHTIPPMLVLGQVRVPGTLGGSPLTPVTGYLLNATIERKTRRVQPTERLAHLILRS